MRKTYGALTAVKSLSFSVAASTCYGLLGPNGAGKTTMLKMIYAKCLRDRDQASVISVFGYDPAANELAIKALSGVVPQEDNLDAELSVLQNLRVYAKLYGLPRGVADRRIDELLSFMELGEKRLVKIRELSGGMKRRLIIARALLNQPRLLILDEPTTGLDPQVRHLIWDKLHQLKREGLTILLTTHYMEEAFQICDRVLIMHKGDKLMEGSPHTLVEGNIERFVLEVRGREAPARLPGPHPGRRAARGDGCRGAARVLGRTTRRCARSPQRWGPTRSTCERRTWRTCSSRPRGARSMTSGAAYPPLARRMGSRLVPPLPRLREKPPQQRPPAVPGAAHLPGRRRARHGPLRHPMDNLPYITFLATGLPITAAMFTAAFECSSARSSGWSSTRSTTACWPHPSR